MQVADTGWERAYICAVIKKFKKLLKWEMSFVGPLVVGVVVTVLLSFRTKPPWA